MTTLLIAVALACMAAPAPSDLSVQIGKIFEVVESAGTVGSPRTAVQQKLARLLPSPGDDHRVRYAYVVALIHEHRYPDALREVNALLKSQPKYLPGHHAPVWLLLTLHKYPEGLTALETLAKGVAEGRGHGRRRAGQHRSRAVPRHWGWIFRRAGRNADQDASPPRQVEARIQARLSGKRREAYDAQVKAVAELFAEIPGGVASRRPVTQDKQNSRPPMNSKANKPPSRRPARIPRQKPKRPRNNYRLDGIY